MDSDIGTYLLRFFIVAYCADVNRIKCAHVSLSRNIHIRRITIGMFLLVLLFTADRAFIPVVNGITGPCNAGRVFNVDFPTAHIAGNSIVFAGMRTDLL